jgi:hypothetical protein
MAIDMSSMIPSLSQAANSGLDPDELLASGDPHGMLAAKQAGVPYVPKRAVAQDSNSNPSTPTASVQATPWRVGPQPANSAPVSEAAMTEAIPPTGARDTAAPRSAFGDIARQALQQKMGVLTQAQNAPQGADVNALESRRAALTPPNAADAQYQPSVGRRIARGIEGVGLGLAEGGLRGAIAGGIAPQTTGLSGYRDPNSKFAAAQQQNQQQVADLDQQITQGNTAAKQREGDVQNLTRIGAGLGSTATEAVESENAEKPKGKAQIITAGDGSLFSVDPDDPTHPSPITGPDGKPIMGKGDGKYVQLEIGGKPHTVEVDDKGNTIKDLGATGEKPTNIRVGSEGTWALDEDKDGKPVLFNSKTGETKAAPNIQKAGTASKAQAALDKVNEPIDAAMNYANDYAANGRFTGSGDEALQEKFFELAKPSVGFRMTQPQIDLLQNSRNWMGTAEAHLRHATKGTWFSDDQRKEIVQTMKDLAAAKKKTSGGASAPASTAQPAAKGGFNWAEHPLVKP